MKKEFETKKFNLKTRTIVNILDKGQCIINGKPAGSNNETTTTSAFCAPTSTTVLI